MVCQAASQTRFRALKHENGIEGEPAIIVRVIACFQPLHDCQVIYFFGWMVKADWPWPRPQHVAWQSSYLNCKSTLPETPLHGLPAYLNDSARVFPVHNSFPGFIIPAFPSLKTEQADDVPGFLQNSNSEIFLKETLTGGEIQIANPASLQKKLLIFDYSGNKTRLFYSPAFPFVQGPIIAATKLTQTYVNEEGEATDMVQNDQTKYILPGESGNNHIVDEESEMREDTEEINALLYSDDDFDDCIDDIDDDEVTSTGRSPLATEQTSAVQGQFEDMKEEVASYDQPNKRLKSIDGGYKRSLPADSASSVRLNETSEYVSDAESKYSCGTTYSPGQTQGKGNLMMGDIQWTKKKIHESLRVLENLVPGAKGKQPLLVIDGTIEYLKSLMSQTGTLGANND